MLYKNAMEAAVAESYSKREWKAVPSGTGISLSLSDHSITRFREQMTKKEARNLINTIQDAIDR